MQCRFFHLFVPIHVAFAGFGIFVGCLEEAADVRRVGRVTGLVTVLDHLAEYLQRQGYDGRFAAIHSKVEVVEREEMADASIVDSRGDEQNMLCEIETASVFKWG